MVLPVLCQDKQGAAGASLLQFASRCRVLLQKCQCCHWTPAFSTGRLSELWRFVVPIKRGLKEAIRRCSRPMHVTER